jgi:hypothetical protein
MLRRAGMTCWALSNTPTHAACSMHACSSRQMDGWQWTAEEGAGAQATATNAMCDATDGRIDVFA